MDHTNNDCLAVAVMSHGSTYGRIRARDKDYTANELVEFFSGENCPSLAGKPKLFFIQVCSFLLYLVCFGKIKPHPLWP